MSRRLPATVVVLLLASSMPPAHASLQLCNRTSYVLYAATAAVQGDKADTKGWTRIIPGACRAAIEGDLLASAYFVYARTSQAYPGAPRAWSGSVALCAKNTDFSLRAAVNGAACPADAFRMPFAGIATHHMRSWITTFREVPDFKTMPDAEQEGLRRLFAALRRDRPPLPVALAEYRKRLGLPENVSTAALYDALETEAMKRAVPVGYTICNDTSGPVWAALGQRKGPILVSRGWWTVAAGACTTAISEAIKGTKVYLHVDKVAGGAVVTGPVRLCVTNSEFEIQGAGRCTQRKLAEAGFVETNAAGAPGFVARVSASGLAPGGS